MRDTIVSSRMAAVQKCLANILMRTGQYDRSIELWLDVLNAELTNWGPASQLSLSTLIETSRLFYQKGDYQSALKRCSEV